jgi:hypothetical protein
MTTMELNLRPFGVVVRDLLIQSGKTTGMGNPNWAGFVDELEGISYENQLAKARAAFDPAEVGEATAFANLQAWIKASKKR